MTDAEIDEVMDYWFGALPSKGHANVGRLRNFARAIEKIARATPADHSDEKTVPHSLYVAGCRDFERVAARCDDAAEIIRALQKALAYWMPKVFDERSAYDAYLLMGYTGEDEPSYWDGRTVTPADQAVGLVLTNDQGEKYGALLDSNIAEKTPLFAAPPSPQVSDNVRDAVDWRALLDAVTREVDDRQYSKPWRKTENAPGHCHEIPAVWDERNGIKSGKSCAWCITWNAARQALAEQSAPPQKPVSEDAP